MSHHWGYVNALFAAALFGASTALNKLVLNNMHPLAVAALVYFSAGVLLFLTRFVPFLNGIANFFKIKNDERPIATKDWPWLIGIAISGSVIAPFLFMYGLSQSSAVNASLLLNAEILFTLIIAVLFLKEKASKKVLAALAVMFLSAIAITTNLDFSGLNLEGLFFGNLFILFGTLFWAIDNSLSKKLSKEYSAVKLASYKSLMGSCILFVAIFFLRIPINLNLANAAYLLIVGLFSIGFSLILYLSALRLIGSMKTAIVFSSASFFGVIAAFLILGEPVSMVQLLAGGFMIFGVFLVSK